jgi:SRSO17 transposase
MGGSTSRKNLRGASQPDCRPEIHEMKTKQLEALRPRLDAYLAKFDDCIKTRPSRRHMRTYVNGQLGELQRKSVEPIALDAGTPPRTLQEFLSIHRWNEEKVATRVRQQVNAGHASDEAVAVFDETSFPKKGEKTAGVQRQYCGATGKLDNCVVTVHLGYVAGDFHTLVDGDLFLPEETWAEDIERRRAAGIPDELRFRTKPQIAIDLLDRTTHDGVRFKYATADELYGRSVEFRRGLADRGLLYVVEVPSDTYGRTPSMARRGRGGRRVDELWERGGTSWRSYHVKDTEKGPVVWDVRATRFRTADNEVVGDESWLLVARNVVSGEVKYYLSNAPAKTRLEVMLHVAFTRADIEQLFLEAKSEVGMKHFEVRHYRPLMRHVVLSMVSLLFLNTEVLRLRGKKPVVERLPGEGGDRCAA